MTPANTGDNIDFQVFDDFRVADAIVSTASSQTVNGDLAISGTLYFPTGSGLELSNVNSSGIITATKFVGDLTGSDVTVSGVPTFSNTVRVGSAITLGSSSGIITATGINVTGVVTAASYQGDGSSLTGVASTDNIITGTAATFTGGVTISGSSNVNVTGIITATSFSGDGSALTGVGGELDITSSLFI